MCFFLKKKRFNEKQFFLPKGTGKGQPHNTENPQTVTPPCRVKTKYKVVAPSAANEETGFSPSLRL